MQATLVDLLRSLDRESFEEMVPVDKIDHADYCRPVSEYRVDQMIRSGFDMDAFVLIVLSMQPNGRYHILDGQHRLAAARKLGYDKVPAKVLIDKTYEQEATLCRKMNTLNRPSALDVFRYRLAENEAMAHDIVRILGRHDMKPALGSSGYPHVGTSGAVSSISAIYRAYQDMGPKGFEEICQILARAWGRERRAWVSPMIDGMRQFWARYRTEVSQKDLVDKLSMITPERILAQAGVGQTRAESVGTAVGKQIVAHYDYKRRNRLPEWQKNPGPGKSYYEETRSDQTNRSLRRPSKPAKKS